MTWAVRRPSVSPWLVCWLFFTALGCTWAVATPVLGVPDEPAHTVYAAAAVRGEVWEETEGPVTRVTVPAGWANVDAVPACYAALRYALCCALCSAL